MKEVEVAGQILQTVVRLEQRNVPDAGLFTILFRLVKHRIGHVDRHHLRDATRKRDCDSSDSTAEIKRAPGGEFRVQVLLYGRKKALDMIGARIEELAACLPLFCRRPKARMSQYGKVGINLSEPLPCFICISHPLPLRKSATNKRFF